MDLRFTAEDEAFRQEVRTFLKQKLPQRLADKVRLGQRLTRDDYVEWHAILNARGWLATHWPKAYGGTGWSVVQTHIFELEAALAHAPKVIPFALSMLGPVLIKYGSEEQKAHWLPRILDGSDWWCQGYSEPGAGSDLASLKTAAVRVGDHYVLNGQKIWTTYAQHANMIFCLVRTSSEGKKQEGISFLLVDMTTPGVEVRPIRLLDGDCEVNEVFFTDVRVPVANLVGEENKGWTYAKYLLTFERSSIADVGGAMAALAELRRIVGVERNDGRPLIEDRLFAARLAKVEIALENMKVTNLRLLAKSAGGGATPLELAAMLKIRGTEIRQELHALRRRAVGSYARPFLESVLEGEGGNAFVGPDYAASAAADYFNNRKLSIFGGSNEVQREIITKAFLEL